MTNEAGAFTLKKYIDDLEHLRNELGKITKTLRSQAKKDYSLPYKCLLSVPGIGFTTAIGLLAEIGDFNRFKDPAEFCIYWYQESIHSSIKSTPTSAQMEN